MNPQELHLPIAFTVGAVFFCVDRRAGGAAAGLRFHWCVCAGVCHWSWRWAGVGRVAAGNRPGPGPDRSAVHRRGGARHVVWDFPVHHSSRDLWPPGRRARRHWVGRIRCGGNGHGLPGGFALVGGHFRWCGKCRRRRLASGLADSHRTAAAEAGQFYALAALLGASVYAGLVSGKRLGVVPAAVWATSATVVLRVLAIVFNWKTRAVEPPVDSP